MARVTSPRGRADREGGDTKVEQGKVNLMQSNSFDYKQDDENEQETL